MLVYMHIIINKVSRSLTYTDFSFPHRLRDNTHSGCYVGAEIRWQICAGLGYNYICSVIDDHSVCSGKGYIISECSMVNVD